MPRFNPDRPHDQVSGIVGVRFLQGGHAFSASGEHVPDPEAGIPNLDPGPTVSDAKVAEPDYPSMQRTPDGNFVEAPPPPVILGPDGLPAVREVAAEEEHVGPSIMPVPIEAPQQPPEQTISKDDMRLKENKMLKIQWEQYHEGEEWPGVAEARRILGIS